MQSSQTPEYALSLKIRRKELGLTQAELADRVGISTSLLTKMERGKRLTRESLEKLEAILGSVERKVIPLESTPREVPRTSLSLGNEDRMMLIERFRNGQLKDPEAKQQAWDYLSLTVRVATKRYYRCRGYYMPPKEPPDVHLDRILMLVDYLKERIKTVSAGYCIWQFRQKFNELENLRILQSWGCPLDERYGYRQVQKDLMIANMKGMLDESEEKIYCESKRKLSEYAQRKYCGKQAFFDAVHRFRILKAALVDYVPVEEVADEI